MNIKDQIEAIDALYDAVELIKQWHKHGESPIHLQERAWNIYYNHSPEMESIRKVLEKHKKKIDPHQDHIA